MPKDRASFDQRAVHIVAYDASWPDRFARLGGQLREALGNVALRIDHIGSTAVPGLGAKPIIDVQISVAELEPVEPFRVPLVRLGYVYRPDNTERTKRYFREPPGQARTHIHVRKAGSFSQQFPLLFRDFLRHHTAAATEYEAVKRELAKRLGDNPQAYTEAKIPIVWHLMWRADEWAQSIGWQPDPSDA